MSGAMNCRAGIPGLTMSIALTGTWWECPGIIKTMHTGFSVRTRIVLCQRPGADTEETGRYDLAERFV